VQVDELCRVYLNLRSPAEAVLSRPDFTQDDIPVPGEDPTLPWQERPLFAKLLAMVVPDLAEQGRLEEILAANRSLRIMARHLESCWVERGLQAARRFPLAWGMRWYVYKEATNDETGRVAQMAEVCPGLLILCKALADREAEEMADILLEVVVHGHKLGKVLDVAPLAWAEAQKLQPGWPGYTGDEEYVTQRLRIRHAPPYVPPWLLWAGVPGYLAPEDIPAEEAERLAWFRATTGTWVGRAKRLLSQEQLNSLFRFLSFNWRRVSRRQQEMAEEWAPYMDHIVDYLRFTGRLLQREGRFGRLEERMGRWETALARRDSDYPPETVLPTFGLQDWQGERARFVPIRTAGDLTLESQRMGHCVGAYAGWALEGSSVFAHGEIRGRSVTVELEPDEDTGEFHLVQAAGRKNRHLALEEMEVVWEWLNEVNKTAQLR